MCQTAALVLLAIAGAVGIAGGALFAQPIAIVLGVLVAGLVTASLRAARRPFMQVLRSFKDQAVEVRVWDVPPPAATKSALVVVSVFWLGAGFHVYFKADGGGVFHLKVAQPREWSAASNVVIIGTARYIQWQGKKLPRLATAPALSVTRRVG